MSSNKRERQDGCHFLFQFTVTEIGLFADEFTEQWFSIGTGFVFVMMWWVFNGFVQVASNSH
ncbi:MAG: hypothetical protein HN457_07900 [Opitutales bacterium]|nr:hypothetical protein [Opitutales bacterium]MBT5170000.1 hypothetical protein [Opitutales bacterium]MBT5814657.1 hypothetical protein [Opitutales bacterium]MBT6769131.1 hypothetical protein [Opitutales bacterium]MDG2253421.1 hypothetical protein [Opitutaceae bacterium]